MDDIFDDGIDAEELAIILAAAEELSDEAKERLRRKLMETEWDEDKEHLDD